MSSDLPLRIDHVGIAVPDLDAALVHHLDVLGARLLVRRTLADQGVEAAALALRDGSEVELLTPLGADTGLARFLDRRGPGLHHVAYAVGDVAAALERMVARGARAIDDHPRPGLHGRPVAFLHPAGMYGVLTELIQVDSDTGGVE